MYKYQIDTKKQNITEKMKSGICIFMIAMTVLSAIMWTATCQNMNSDKQFENYVRRNTPSGFTMSAYVEICESCGVLYGHSFSYKCLTDRSLKTFKGCYIAVNDRR
ncbi:hypothetical protein ACF0H5_015477 [Mactra antiquata]